VALVNFPNVCTNETLPGKAFCAAHCKFCEERNPPIPTKLRDFLKYVGKSEPYITT
jgi:hypothetical protein